MRDADHAAVAVALQAHREGMLATDRLALVLAHFDDPSSVSAPVDVLLCRLGGLRPEQVARAVEACGVPAQDGRPRAFSPRLTILETLGRGAMGVVYKAFDRALKRVVALKVVTESASAERRRLLLARFEREAQVLARVRHPAVVPVFDVGISAEGDPYLVMDFVAGRTLERLTEDRPGGLEVAKVVAWGATLAEALHACHLAGVTHRDVKPGNIIIDELGEARLVDFGVARDAEAGTRITKDDAMVGTISYMAPEQVTGGEVGPLADVWALGATLHHALTGTPPFEAGHPLMVLDLILRGPTPDPRAARPDLPVDVANVVVRCLRRDPTARFPSAATLAQELRLLGATRRPRRRRQGGVWVGAIVGGIGTVVGLAGIAVALRSSQGTTHDVPARPVATSPTVAVPPSPTESALSSHAARTRSSPDGTVVTSVGGIPLVWLPAGHARLGPPAGVELAPLDEPVERTAHFDRGRWIGRTEVTRDQFAAFCQATGHPMPTGRTRIAGVEHIHAGDEPIVNVTWGQARAFCEWVGARLPSGDEWEYAARGSDGRRWPWGDQWPSLPLRANVADATASRTYDAPFQTAKRIDDGFAFQSPVGSFPAGASPFGCLDMAGNAAEWSADAGPDPSKGHLVRGGTYTFTDWGARPWGRFQWCNADGGADDVGFRIALDDE
jgi:serine/threonine protein kinase